MATQKHVIDKASIEQYLEIRKVMGESETTTSLIVIEQFGSD